MPFPESSNSNRRDFLKESAAIAIAAGLSTKAKAADDHTSGEWRNRAHDMAYRRLGRTNFMISEIVQGGSTISPTNYRHVEVAIERGLNYLDTAAAYGNPDGQSELGFSRVIEGSSKREKIFLASKVSQWDVNRNRLFRDLYESLSSSERMKVDHTVRDRLNTAPALHEDYFATYGKWQRGEYQNFILSSVMESRFPGKINRRKNYRDTIINSVEESLKRLNTDYLDVLICPHGASSYEEVTKFPEIFEAFEQLKKEGKARHLGVSSHTDPAGVLQGAVDTGMYSVAMIAYNIVNHRFIDKTLTKAKKADVGVIGMKVARAVHSGGMLDTPDDPKRIALIQKAVPGQLKVPVKAYLWGLRDSRLAAVNSEMNNQEMVNDNLPLAQKKT
jgi:aryl-alcohol dehydrogenase-like predicted oxidoreductase